MRLLLIVVSCRLLSWRQSLRDWQQDSPWKHSAWNGTYNSHVNHFYWRVFIVPSPSYSRYELPQPSAAQKNDVTAWRECVENSMAQLEHQAGRWGERGGEGWGGGSVQVSTFSVSLLSIPDHVNNFLFHNFKCQVICSILHPLLPHPSSILLLLSSAGLSILSYSLSTAVMSGGSTTRM